MLVEDELPLLQLLERYLTRVGYGVRTFSASSTALREFEANPENYDLVIADLGMPDMPGDTMLMRMLGIKPALLVLICSGSPFYLVHHAAGTRKTSRVFAKTFPAEDAAGGCGRAAGEKIDWPRMNADERE